MGFQRRMLEEESRETNKIILAAVQQFCIPNKTTVKIKLLFCHTQFVPLPYVTVIKIMKYCAS